jgi:methyl-accepting chemotaxis protein
VAKNVEAIATASNQQSQGIGQNNDAVAQMDKVTQQVASNAEESASASEELSAQAAAMQDVVADMVALIGTQNGNGQTPQLAHASHAPLEQKQQKRLGKSEMKGNDF